MIKAKKRIKVNGSNIKNRRGNGGTILMNNRMNPRNMSISENGAIVIELLL